MNVGSHGATGITQWIKQRSKPGPTPDLGKAEEHSPAGSVGDSLLCSGHHGYSGMHWSLYVKNVTMVARKRASENGGVEAAQNGFGFASRKRSSGIPKTG